MILNMTLIHPNGTVEPLGQDQGPNAEVQAYFIAPWPGCTVPTTFDTDLNTTLGDAVTSASWRTSIFGLVNGS
jgi:hypothetical protein